MAQRNVKAEARKIVDRLPNEATWDDLMYEIYVRQAVDVGLEDSRDGRTIPVELVRRKLGLPAG